MRQPLSKVLLRIALIVLALPVTLAALVAGAFVLVNRTNGTLISSGERRRYLLYVPQRYDPSVPTPLVISLHGFAEWPAHQRDISAWNDLADEHGFIVVYPMGTRFPLRWQVGGDPGRDVMFISDLIDALAAQYSIDPDRVYANGLSNGGGMSFALACHLSDRIAAFGSVSGAYVLPWAACRAYRQVPAIIFHGTADPIVPYLGGQSGPSHAALPDIAGWVEELARRNGCTDAVDLAPSGEVRGVRYTGCDADVTFYTVEGGGHAWPGGGWMPKSIVGNITQDIDATRVMWEFFEQHPLRRG
ncbi:MAG: alpha/beta hydrolase-fold protein [Anaerolineae bacterium]|nr:alpha/beta hydrolase-fold protein [Anaerolineae bacterium]